MNLFKIQLFIIILARITHLEVNSTSPCGSNGITFYDGRNALSPNRGTFCDCKNVSILSSGFELYVEFKTDATLTTVNFKADIIFYGKVFVIITTFPLSPY